MDDLLKSYSETRATIERRIEELKKQLGSCEGNISAQSVRYRIKMLRMESDEIARTMATIKARG